MRAIVVAVTLVAGCSGRPLVAEESSTSGAADDDDAAQEDDDDAAEVDDDDGAPPPRPGSSSAGDATSAADDSTSEPLPGPDTPYPYCEWNDGEYEEFCPPTEGAHGFSNWHVDGASARYCEGGDDCNACICAATCRDPESGPDDASFCPIPSSGTAQPECIDPASMCYLTCDQGESCPDDMTCVPQPEIGRSVCAWMRA
jgi:hypothetical protein